MVKKLWIYLLWLLRYDFLLILNFDFRFRQEVKVKLGSPFCKYFLTINDLYNGAKILNLPLVVVEIWFCFNIKLWLPVWTGSKGQIGSLFVNVFGQLTICTMVQKLWIYLLWLLRYGFCLILKFDFRFGQEVKVKLGSLFVNIFWQLTICTMVQTFWINLLWLLRYDFFIY